VDREAPLTGGESSEIMMVGRCLVELVLRYTKLEMSTSTLDFDRLSLGAFYQSRRGRDNLVTEMLLGLSTFSHWRSVLAFFQKSMLEKVFDQGTQKACLHFKISLCKCVK
jgi:hypothetical protein